MILEPNRQRRRRAFRVIAALAAVILAGTAVASGWTLPTFSSPATTPGAVAGASPTAAVVATPAESSEPTTVPEPTPAPTPGPDGCLPPPAGQEPATVVSHGSRTDKVVALTFDDGNNPENVQRIVRFLRYHRVNATFFPTARAVELAPTTWLYVAQSGFPIANHTYHHISLKGLCFAKQLAELEKAESVFLEQALPMQGYMRPPYEDFDANTRLAANAAGEDYVVLWDVDTLDWTGVSRATIVSRALAGTSGSIILMHTTPRATASALDEIVAQFQKRGFTFVTVGQLLGIPGPVPFH